MKAAFVEELGDIGLIRYGELPDPVAGPGEVLVRTEAICMNMIDTIVRAGGYPTEVDFPLCLGRDLVGTVVAPDPDGSGPALGSSVWTNSAGYGGRPGASAELVAVQTDRLYPLPNGVDPVGFVASLHPGATAHGVAERARLAAGDRIAVAGANGAVGACLVQVAAQRGARVAALVRSDAAAETLRRLGADEVVVAQGADAPAAAREALGGLDVLVDPTGRLPVQDCVRALDPRGRIVLIAGREPLHIERWDFYVRELELSGFVMSRMDVGELARASAALNEHPLEVAVGEMLGLAEVAQVQRRIAEADLPRTADGLVGRLVIVP